jgi:hypothetical protein
VNIRKSRHQHRRLVPSDFVPPPSGDEVIQHRRFASAIGDAGPLRLRGGHERGRQYGEDQPAPLANILKTRVVGDPNSAVVAAFAGRSNRSFNAGPYPEVAQSRGRFARNTGQPQLLHGRVVRYLIIPEEEPTTSFARRWNKAIQSVPPSLYEGSVSRIRFPRTEPDAIVSGRPFGHRMARGWLTAIVAEYRVTRRYPVADPADIALPLRRSLTCHLPPQPGRIAKGKNFHTGESYDPHFCPSRPPYEFDRSDAETAQVGDEDSRPTLVEESSDASAAPIFPDECR